MRGTGWSDPSTAGDDARGAMACPYCGGTNTEREHPRGPSRCRAIHYCMDCRESFEAFG